MTDYNDLTEKEQEALAVGDTFIRNATAALIQFTRNNNMVLNLQYWTDNITPIMEYLDSSELIPQSTDRIGASDLTAEQLISIQDGLEAIYEDLNDNLALVLKIAGVSVGP